MNSNLGGFLMSNAKILTREETLDCPVTAFPFGKRALQIFQNQGVKTMGDVVDTDAIDWLFSFKCDKRTLGEIVGLLQMMGFQMKNGNKVFSDEAIEGHIASLYEGFA
jgi:hypothetical protein